MTFFSNLATYTVETQEARRVVEFKDGQPIWADYIIYNIYINGEWINACTDENDIEDLVRLFEYGDDIDPIYFTGITNG